MSFFPWRSSAALQLAAALLLTSPSPLGAAEVDDQSLSDRITAMRQHGSTEAEIAAFVQRGIALEHMHAYLQLFAQEHDAGRIGAIAGLHPPTSLVIAELLPLLRQKPADDVFANLLYVFNEGNHVPALPEQDRRELWNNFTRVDTNARFQLLIAVRALGPFTAEQVGRIATWTSDASEGIRLEAVKTLAAWPASPGAMAALRAVLDHGDDEATLQASDAVADGLPATASLTPSRLATVLAGPDFITALPQVRALDAPAFVRLALRILPDQQARMTCRAWFLRELGTRQIRDAQATVQVLAFMGQDGPAYLQILGNAYLRRLATVEPESRAALAVTLVNPDPGIAYWTCEALLHEGVASAFAIPVIARQLPLLTARQSLVLGGYLDLIERNPQAGAVVQKNLTALVRADALAYAGEDASEAGFLRARALDVLAKIADPGGARAEIVDFLVSSGQPEEQVAALRALARLAPEQQGPMIPLIARFLAADFDDRIIDGANIKHRYASFSDDPNSNTTPRIEAIRALIALGPEGVLRYRAALERLAAEPTDVRRTRLLVRDHPAWASEALQMLK